MARQRMGSTPAERTAKARAAANASWARTPDRAARTAAAREAAVRRFERQVDPDGVLSPAERARRGESARRAYYQSMTLKSLQARRRRAG